jgi:FAD/FMN-containing dehydrogenase
MSRRLQRSRRFGGGLSQTLFQRVLALSAGRPIFTANYYAVDGVSGKVSAFVDWNDPTHVLAQTTSANQVAIPAAHADFSNQLCGTFTAHAYQSNRAVAQWIFAHDGVSCERVEVLTPTSAVAVPQVVSTTVWAAVAAGAQLYYTGGGAWNHSIYTSAAGISAINSPFGAATVNVPRYLSARHKAADTPDWELRQNGALVASGAYSVAPTATDPEVPFTLGCNNFATVSNPAPMRWRAAAFFPALDAAGRAIVDAWCVAGCPT